MSTMSTTWNSVEEQLRLYDAQFGKREGKTATASSSCSDTERLHDDSLSLVNSSDYDDDSSYYSSDDDDDEEERSCCSNNSSPVVVGRDCEQKEAELCKTQLPTPTQDRQEVEEHEDDEGAEEDDKFEVESRISYASSSSFESFDDESYYSDDENMYSFQDSETADDSVDGVGIARWPGASLSNYNGAIGGHNDNELGFFLNMEMIQKLRFAPNTQEQGLDDDTIVSKTKEVVYAMQTVSPMDDSRLADTTVPKPFDLYKDILLQCGHKTSKLPFQDPTIKNSWVKGNTEMYDKTLMEAVRHNDLQAVKDIHTKAQGKSLQCCNTFGETILHAIVRHVGTDILHYLVYHAQVSMQVCCDGGRTILHDACWTSTPNFDCITIILSHHPEFFRVADKHGFTPLEYAPRESHGAWRDFLTDHEYLVLPIE